MSIAAGRTRAWVEVDLNALARNARRYAELMDCPLLPMVKADAYGLGAAAVARALEPLNPQGFGVATMDEAAALRRAGITRPLVLFSPLYPEILQECFTWDIRPSIDSLPILDAWRETAGGPFHLAVDTGLSREGIPWHDEATWRAVGERIAKMGRRFEGIYTHFHSAESDYDACCEQLARLRQVLGWLPRKPPLIHVANSAAAPIFALSMARPGILLYGGQVERVEVEPVVEVYARVVSVRRLRAGDTVSYGATWRAEAPTTIATVAIGYADGFPLSLSNRGQMALNGIPCQVVGRVTMDLTMLDAGDLNVQVGDVATIIGDGLTLEDQAARAESSPYELLTGLSPRLPRLYTGGV